MPSSVTFGTLIKVFLIHTMNYILNIQIPFVFSWKKWILCWFLNMFRNLEWYIPSHEETLFGCNSSTVEESKTSKTLRSLIKLSLFFTQRRDNFWILHVAGANGYRRIVIFGWLLFLYQHRCLFFSVLMPRLKFLWLDKII